MELAREAIASGTEVVTTTIVRDNSGNVIQRLTDGALTTYRWDYGNRLIAIGYNNATTSYAYDAFGNRVSQITATTTTLYPSKFYTVASSTGSGAKFSTTTELIFGND